MAYHLVRRIHDSKGAARVLYREDIFFAVPPVVGDVVFWDSGWGGDTVQYRYVGRDWVELGLPAVGEHEVETYVSGGWLVR